MLHAAASSQDHPKNRKVALRVHARALQQAAGLSEQQLLHVLRICGTLYDSRTGVVTLTCRRFIQREENRKWCYSVLGRLIQEGQTLEASSSRGGASAVAAAAGS